MHDSLRSSIELALNGGSVPVSERTVTVETGVPEELYEFISKAADPSPFFTKVVSVQTRAEIEKIQPGECSNLVNLQRINDIKYLNKFFNTVNKIIPHEGIFIGCVETLEERKARIYRKYPIQAARVFYVIDFIFKRVLPKWELTRKIYFLVNNGRNRALSRSETLGRLISCGFRIENLKVINGRLYFAARNVQGPAFDENPTYGLVVKLDRIGRNGKPVKVYKLRTMHPYAEYLQEYVFELNNLKEGGKFKKDFRVTRWGRFLRKLWIDEIPMIYNFIRGDLKLVGVRPLSSQYLGLYTEDHRKKRMNYKPGLVPPFYADLPKTLPEIMESEARYFAMYDKHPFLTDTKYFWKVFYNIVLKRARSS